MIVLCAAILACTTGVASAEDHVWSSWNGGSFNHWLNWVPQYVPGEDDNAIFEDGMAPANEVVFYEAVTNDQCIFRTAQVIMDLGSFTYTLDNPGYGLIVGDSAGHVADVLLFHGALDADRVHVGLWDDSVGTLDLDYGLTMNVSVMLTVANDGDGLLTVYDGASVTAEWATIGVHDLGNTGVMDVIGSDAEFTVNQTLTVGQDGDGTLNIVDGATANPMYVNLGGGPTGTGAINVLGYDSTFTADQLSLGLEGSGTLNVEYGGQVSASSIIRVGWSPSGFGDMTVTGEDSAVSSDGYFSVGDQGLGTMSILDGAAASAQWFIVGWIGTATGDLDLYDLGSTLTAHTSFTVGHDGDGTANIAQQAALTAGTLLVGVGGTGNGELNVADTDTTVTVQNNIHAGQWGTGVINITNGADVRTIEPSGWIIAGEQVDSDGTILVDGGSTLTAEQAPIVVGGGGQGTLTITGGSQVYSSGELFMGGGAEAVGQLTISGPGSKYESDSAYTTKIGDQGDATITIESGGLLDVFGTFVIGQGAGSSGQVTLTGINSTLQTRFLTVGREGAGMLIVNDGRVALGVDPATVPAGEVHVGDGCELQGHDTLVGDVVNLQGKVRPGADVDLIRTGTLSIDGEFQQDAAGTLQVDIGGVTQGSEYDALSVSGTASLDGTLHIELIDGFEPEIYQEFVIVTASAVSGQFAGVSGSGNWSVIYNADSVTIKALGSGDLDCNGGLDFDDIDPFVLALSGQAGYEAAFPDCNWLNADCNGDGSVDFDDIDHFVAILSGG